MKSEGKCSVIIGAGVNRYRYKLEVFLAGMLTLAVRTIREPLFNAFSFTVGPRRSYAPQQRLYFRPLPQGHEALRAIVATPLSCFDLPLNKPSMISVSQISTANAGCENV